MAALGQGSPAATPPQVHDLIQAIKDLDNHLSWGGALPDEWGGASFAGSTARMHEVRRHQAPTRATQASEPDPVQDIIRRM